MALFNKKKSQDAPVNPTAPPTSAPTGGAAGSDFSDFSPEALAASEPPAKGKKGKAPKVNKKVGGNGRGVKPGTAIGLNIGNDSIKVVEAVAKGNEISIVAMGMVPTPAESLSNGVVMSANSLVMGIREAMAQAGIKSKRVVTSIAGTGALVVRIVEVPKMGDAELMANMKMDADRYIPFPPSEVEMDFKALRELPSDPDAANMEVLLAAAQREIIDLHVQVLQDAKLDPRAIDVEPLAVARALTHPLTAQNSNGHANGHANGAAVLGSDADYSDVSAILNIGASGTEISILRGDLLVFTRTVPTGGNAMTQSLVDTLGLAWGDAEQLKREMGDALPPTGDGGSSPAGSTPGAANGGFGGGTDSLDWSEPNNATDAGGWDDFPSDDAAVGETTMHIAPGAPTEISGAAQTATSPGAPQAADPFADDFFDQGPATSGPPLQKEPGEQHQQKEESDALPPTGSTPGGSTPGGSTPEGGTPDGKSFFDFGEDPEPAEKIPTLKDGAPTSYADLLGVEEDDFSDLPTLTPNAPPPQPLASAFDFPFQNVAGAAATGAAAPISTSAVNPPARVESVPDAEDASLPSLQGAAASTESIGTPRIEADEASLLPSESATASTAPADFGFSFDEPVAPAVAPVAETAATETAPDAAFDFGFGGPAETPAAAAPTETVAAASPAVDDPFAEFMASAAETPQAEPVTLDKQSAPAGSTPGATAPADDFDLDSLFGGDAPAGAGAAAVGATPAGADGLDMGDFGLGGGASAGATDFSADLSDFGAGLGGANAGEIDAKTLHSVLEPVLENLVNEVRRSLEYHTTRYPEAAVRHVTIVGGGAKMKNLDAYMTQKLGLPTSVGNPTSRLSINAPKLPPGYADENGTFFAVALGLAMRELTK